MEATEVSVYGFIYKLMCSGSQRIREQMITRTRRKGDTFLIVAATSVRRCVWMRSRSQEWWDRDVNGFTETDFIQNFRMSRATFNCICQRLFARLSRQDTQFRRPIFLRKRVGVGLSWLATGAGYLTCLASPQLARLSTSFARPCTMSSCLTTLFYLKEMTSGRSYKASERGGVS